MPPTNDFLPFCANNTGTNLIAQSAYVVSTARPIGNQPGIASSAFNNKALRQGTYIAANLAQYLANFTNTDVLDNNTPAQILSQIMGSFQPLAPVITQYLSGTGTWNATVAFFCASANATAGATYTNNSVTYTVSETIAAGLILKATGNGAPSSNGGVLTKTSGTGDATITFYTYRKALHLQALMVGGGGGGTGGGGAPPAAGDGTDTTFGTSLLVAGKGLGSTQWFIGGKGGTASLGSGPVGLAFAGGNGVTGQTGGTTSETGGSGGSTPFGGAGVSGDSNVAAGNPGYDAIVNTGSGGGGASFDGSGEAGAGGGAGGYINATIFGPVFSYTYSVGASGVGGVAGGGGTAGGAGGSGLIQITEIFQ